MTVSKRRRTFERSRPEHPLTQLKLDLLDWIGHLGISTTPQLCLTGGFSDQACRKHLRDLYDMGLVDRTGVDRANLAGPDVPNTTNLLHGRAPVIHFITKDGQKMLVELGLQEAGQFPDIPQVGPKHSLHVAHELQVRDARIWLHLQHMDSPQHAGVEHWHTGPAAVCTLDRTSAPYEVRPDAWFTYHLDNGTLVGFLEVDRGTEKSPKRWEDKFVTYAYLMSSGLVQAHTGYQKGRVIITVPNYKRLVTLGTVQCVMIAEVVSP
jgi:hypothetical protein